MCREELDVLFDNSVLIRMYVCMVYMLFMLLEGMKKKIFFLTNERENEIFSLSFSLFHHLDIIYAIYVHTCIYMYMYMKTKIHYKTPTVY